MGGAPGSGVTSDRTLDPYGAFLTRHDQAARGHGPLAGLRLCVKDNIKVAGEPFTAGHALYGARLASRTASAVRRLQTAGVAFVGMARTDSGGFGMTTPEVHNPRFAGRTVGGSSGGCAAAVAAGLADIALGTDTGGSCRVPAACTDTVGFKPTYGAIEVDGVMPLASTLDHVGLLAAKLPLLHAAADMLLPRDTAQRTDPAVETLRIAVETTLPAFTDIGVSRRFDDLIAWLRRQGHEIVQTVLPGRTEVARAFGVLVLEQAAAVYRSLSCAQIDQLGMAARIALRHVPDASAVGRAAEDAAAFVRAYRDCLDRFDLLMSPTLFIAPPQRGVHSIHAAGQKWPLISVFAAGTCFANLAGLPAIALPMTRGNEPFSLHLAARRGADRWLLAVAGRIFADASRA